MALSPLALALMGPNAIPPGQLAPTNTLGAFTLAQDAAEKNYQAKLGQQNAMWGGLAGLGGAGISALGSYSLRNALLGGGKAAGATPAAGVAGAPLDLATPAVADAGAAAWPATADLGMSGSTLASAGGIGSDFAAGAPIAADMAASAPAIGEAAAATMPEWLTTALSFLPFLA